MKLKHLPRAAILTFLCLGAIPGHRAEAGSFVTRMIESTPVVTNGLEFVAAVEEEWVCFNPPIGEDPVQVQLFIRNTTGEPLLFPVFDTFSIVIKDSAGRKIVQHGGRNGTCRTKPVVIDAGGRYCLSRKAFLQWNPDGKSRTFFYYDGTGSEFRYGPLATGSYTLSFWCKNPVKPGADETASQTTIWNGETVTNEVQFKIVDP